MAWVPTRADEMCCRRLLVLSLGLCRWQGAVAAGPGSHRLREQELPPSRRRCFTHPTDFYPGGLDGTWSGISDAEWAENERSGLRRKVMLVVVVVVVGRGVDGCWHAAWCGLLVFGSWHRPFVRLNCEHSSHVQRYQEATPRWAVVPFASTKAFAPHFRALPNPVIYS